MQIFILTKAMRRLTGVWIVDLRRDDNRRQGVANALPLARHTRRTRRRFPQAAGQKCQRQGKLPGCVKPRDSSSPSIRFMF